MPGRRSPWLRARLVGDDLRCQRQLGRLESVVLCHRKFRSVKAIQNQGGKERETHLARDTLTMLARVIDQQHRVIDPFLPRQINVLAAFDHAFGTGNQRSTVAPRS